MKKLFSLSVAAMLSAAAFAQDTIPNRQNSNPSNRDTIPGSNRNWNDTSNRSQTMDSTYQRRNYPDSMNNDTSSFNNRNQSSDSLGTSANQNSNWNSTTRSDSMSTSNSTQSNTTGNNTTGNTTGNNTTGNNTNTTSSSNTTTSSDSATIVTDRVIMRGDTMYIIKNGESTNLSETFKLESGATVTTDGTVTYPSGKTVKLKNGQFIEITKATTTNDSDEMNTTDKKTTKTEKSTKSTKKSSTKKSKPSKSSK